MTIVVARNVPGRYRGFLSSVMLEVSPGTYVSPKMTRGVRERLWAVCCEWSSLLPSDGSLTILCNDQTAPAGLRIMVIGAPKAELLEHDGIWLDRQDLTAAHEKILAGLGE